MGENVLVVHGMRRGVQNKALKYFISQLFKNSNINYQIAFLESDTNDFYNVISTLVKQGKFEFNIVPLLLFSAKHYLKDIPEILQHIKEMFPHMRYRITPPLSTHPHLINIIDEKINAAMFNRPSINKVIFIAHGSENYEQPIVQLKQLIQQCNIVNKSIDMLTLYGEYNYQKILPKILEETQNILIVPIFLYDGYLVNKMKSKISKMRMANHIEYTESLNFHPILEMIIKDQITQLEVYRNVSSPT
ncbi:sirohydrochlorin chelatase [Staphylococcus cohnii]|uniref:Sirohydrochlorin chelatase n=1 Tax=Staphylococcus cohnii TaxID=29382 RepID=A0A2T4LPD3_9STAP|nr:MULTISPECIES: sirohydrochlorin chelatase [Staphylococcus]MBA1353914.1 hypothetical protein [Staphylococcus cohnii]MBA1390287.1 hypothetical protein [Staphylococcus cohnii]MBB2507265.1 Sirohydrochlorin ferrochelatase [Staphylococcus cohnii subsp. barensis]MCE5098688.1 sirohydrochlorin chelatase [Staphylococcus cohnii]MSU29723.1 sirohydrochlorin chelatase [Staphylococcus sp. McC-251-APC-3A2]